MYINPFWAGVIFTVLVEMAVIFLLAIISRYASKTHENTSKNDRS